MALTKQEYEILAELSLRDYEAGLRQHIDLILKVYERGREGGEEERIIEVCDKMRRAFKWDGERFRWDQKECSMEVE